MNSMYKGSLGSSFPMAARIIGYVAVAAGGILLFVTVGNASLPGFLFALLITLLGSLLAFSDEIAEIDFEGNRVRKYYRLMAVVPMGGKWEKIPPLRMITLTTVTRTYSNNLTMGGAQTYSQSTTMALNIKGINERFRMTVREGSGDQLMNDAIDLALHFKVDLLDARTQQKELLKYEDLKNSYGS